MKSIGMARKVDDLGRIVLPIELRRQLGIRAGDELDIAVDGSTVMLRKIEAHCTFCGGDVELRTYREKQVCKVCLTELTGPAQPAASGAAPEAQPVGPS